MAASYPTNGTFFDTLKRSFTAVPIDSSNDNAIPTSEFLEAAESLTTLFDVLGSVAFTPVKNDMLQNVKKIRDRQLAAPGKARHCRRCGLDFTAQALRQNLSKPSDELSTSFRTAYAATLKPHHSFMIKPIFSAAMSATPYRKDFYAKLGSDQQKVEKELEAWLQGLEKCVGVLNKFLATKEAKW
ncbi:hypothetical protein H2199_007859 [Coniosporium tulheliwenetii]|uniref:Uncharacterized protein n=1 Tax=Coniosporium tulheliwenetii TaxID=3383036 RepID=A0ACC2YNG0_9PEZI|nr:hypothetical protein H2199_007859 [Cladosporium sp. JES 115]